MYEQAREICSRADFLRRISRNHADRKLLVTSMYCSLANDAFADFLVQHYQEELYASIEEMSLADVILSVSGGLSDVGMKRD